MIYFNLGWINYFTGEGMSGNLLLQYNPLTEKIKQMTCRDDLSAYYSFINIGHDSIYGFSNEINFAARKVQPKFKS